MSLDEKEVCTRHRNILVIWDSWENKTSTRYYDCPVCRLQEELDAANEKVKRLEEEIEELESELLEVDGQD